MIYINPPSFIMFKHVEEDDFTPLHNCILQTHWGGKPLYITGNARQYRHPLHYPNYWYFDQSEARMVFCNSEHSTVQSWGEYLDTTDAPKATSEALAALVGNAREHLDYWRNNRLLKTHLPVFIFHHPTLTPKGAKL